MSASLLFPENELGKKFWERVYADVKDKLGTNNLPTETLNKVWIVPDEASIYENGTSVFVTASHLKVMLEDDYKNPNLSTANDSQQTKLIKEIILPAIEKEVNEGKNFASLRQIYNSMILATWYKQNLKESFLSKEYVDQNKISGVNVDDPAIGQKIYDQYLSALKEGVYDYVKEDYDPATQEVTTRKYFSGGVEFKETRLRKVSRAARNLLGMAALTVSVSKAVSLVSVWPSCRRPAASTAV